LSAYDSSDNLLETHDLPYWQTDTNYFYGIAHSDIKKLVLVEDHYYFNIDGADIIFLDYPGGGNVVPLPGAVWLLGSGLLGLIGLRRKLKV
jgi:hypothetical protein